MTNPCSCVGQICWLANAALSERPVPHVAFPELLKQLEPASDLIRH